jgi:actin-related protein
MPVILGTQEAEIRRIMVQRQYRQIAQETQSQKTHHKKGLVERLKVQALSSNSSTAKKKKIKEKYENIKYLSKNFCIFCFKKFYFMLSFTGKWMELENIILSEVSLAQKTKNRMFSLICGH